MKKKFTTLFSVLLVTCLTLLAGCNGPSEDSNENTTPLVPNSISLSILNAAGESQNSFDKSEIITLKARVRDDLGKDVTNQLVTFSIGLGTLNPQSKLTDANGYAIVSINNTNLDIGAAKASATILTLIDTVDYEYTNSDIVEPVSSINSQLLLNGDAINQFNADESVQITTSLMDAEGQPINNAIINYTADIGTLSASSALTVNGIAHVTLSSDESNIGAGVVTSTLANDSQTVITHRLNYEILPANTPITDTEVRLGYFDQNNEFVEGKIKLSIADNTISAGGTLGLSVDLVDSTNTLITSPAEVSFTSNCVQSGRANIDATVFSIKGNAQATFEDVSCAGTSGTEDVIIASISINGITNSASSNIIITGEQLGSIEFISAEPNSIVLKGTGGQETSTLTFIVKTARGNILAQQVVDFTLNTTVGGITLSRDSGFTNSQGLVTTQVRAGTVPTAVRVTAKAEMTVDNNQVSVQTQSDLLSINTGLPEQRSLTIAANPLNPEADNNGETSQISVWLADNFNNPVPDGTTVNFTTEGGVIEPSCTTISGQCSVTWTSAQPRVDDHRVTILATALGHETFFDTNGNNTFDDTDGNAIIDSSVSSGYGRHNAEPSGFVDMSEVWRDDNENGQYDNGEVFLDFNQDLTFSSEDGLFNGPQCEGTKCATANSIHVRKALTLIMSGSNGSYKLFDSTTVYNDSINGINVDLPNLADGDNQLLTFSFADLSEQALPIGSTIAVEASAGNINGSTSATVPNTNQTGSISFFIANPVGGDPEATVLTFTITAPNGRTTVLLKTLNFL